MAVVVLHEIRLHHITKCYSSSPSFCAAHDPINQISEIEMAIPWRGFIDTRGLRRTVFTPQKRSCGRVFHGSGELHSLVTTNATL